MRICLAQYGDEYLVSAEYAEYEWCVPCWDEWGIPELVGPWKDLDTARQYLKSIQGYLEYRGLEFA